jgi:Flp pilus assembly pilin Flp
MLDTTKFNQILKQKQAKKQKGASMIEYALVVAAVVGIAVYFFSGNNGISGAMNTKMNAVAANISK